MSKHEIINNLVKQSKRKDLKHTYIFQIKMIFHVHCSFNAERLKRKVNQKSRFQLILSSFKNMPKTSCRRACFCVLFEVVQAGSTVGEKS